MTTDRQQSADAYLALILLPLLGFGLVAAFIGVERWATSHFRTNYPADWVQTAVRLLNQDPSAEFVDDLDDIEYLKYHLVVGFRPEQLMARQKTMPVAEVGDVFEASQRIRRRLERIGGRHPEVLAAAMEAEEPRIRQSAADLYRSVGGQRAIPILERALYDPDKRVAAYAIKALLAHAGPRRAAGPLIEAMSSDDCPVPEYVLDALQQLSAPTIWPHIPKLLEDYHTSDRPGRLLLTITNAKIFRLEGWREWWQEEGRHLDPQEV